MVKLLSKYKAKRAGKKGIKTRIGSGISGKTKYSSNIKNILYDIEKIEEAEAWSNSIKKDLNKELSRYNISTNENTAREIAYHFYMAGVDNVNKIAKMVKNDNSIVNLVKDADKYNDISIYYAGPNRIEDNTKANIEGIKEANRIVRPYIEKIRKYMSKVVPKIGNKTFYVRGAKQALIQELIIYAHKEHGILNMGSTKAMKTLEKIYEVKFNKFGPKNRIWINNNTFRKNFNMLKKEIIGVPEEQEVQKPRFSLKRILEFFNKRRKKK